MASSSTTTTIISNRRRRISKQNHLNNNNTNAFNYNVPTSNDINMYDKHYDDDEIHRLKQTIMKVLPSKDERKKLKRSLTKIRDTTVKTSVVHILKMLDSICNVIDHSMMDTLIENKAIINKNQNQYVELINEHDDFTILSDIPKLKEKIKQIEERQENDHSKKNILREMAEFEERIDKTNIKVSKLNSQLTMLHDSQPSATANFQSQLLKIETQSRHAIDEVQLLNEKVDLRGRRQLQELEKLCSGQVSLYLSGISNDIVNLSNKVDVLLEVTEKHEKRMDAINNTSNNNLQGLANDICKIVVDLQNNRDATLNLQKTMEHTRKNERKKYLFSQRQNVNNQRNMLNDIMTSNKQQQQQQKHERDHQQGFMDYVLFDDGSRKKKDNNNNSSSNKNHEVVDIVEYNLLKKTVKELQVENKILKANVYKSLEKIDSFTEMSITAYKNSEKRTREELNQLREALLSFSKQLCMVTECYNGIK